MKVLAPRRYETPGEIISRFTARAPVDLNAMAAALDVDVKVALLGPEVAGRIQQAPSGRYVVSLNMANSEQRRRFTLAHELAHYVLHRDMIGDGITDSPLYRSNMSSATEREANSYAAALLMPPALVRQAWEHGYRAADSIARYFNVSRPAAAIRLEELGYPSG